MNEIFDATIKTAGDIRKTSTLMRAFNKKDHEEKLQKIIMRIDLLAKQATFLILVRFCAHSAKLIFLVI